MLVMFEEGPEEGGGSLAHTQILHLFCIVFSLTVVGARKLLSVHFSTPVQLRPLYAFARLQALPGASLGLGTAHSSE